MKSRQVLFHIANALLAGFAPFTLLHRRLAVLGMSQERRFGIVRLKARFALEFLVQICFSEVDQRAVRGRA